jgi:hypothetical protein
MIGYATGIDWKRVVYLDEQEIYRGREAPDVPELLRRHAAIFFDSYIRSNADEIIYVLKSRVAGPRARE